MTENNPERDFEDWRDELIVANGHANGQRIGAVVLESTSTPEVAEQTPVTTADWWSEELL